MYQPVARVNLHSQLVSEHGQPDAGQRTHGRGHVTHHPGGGRVVEQPRVVVASLWGDRAFVDVLACMWGGVVMSVTYVGYTCVRYMCRLHMCPLHVSVTNVSVTIIRYNCA